MTLEIIGQIFGVLTTVAVVISNQLPKRWHIMLGFMVVNALAAINVLLTGSGLTACMACVVAVIHSPVNAYRAKKEMESPLAEKLIFSALYFVGWGIGFYLSCKSGTASWLDAMPFVATVFFVLSMLAKKEKYIRIWTLGNALIYAVYYAIFGNIVVVAQLFAIGSVIIALIRYRDKNPKKEEVAE